VPVFVGSIPTSPTILAVTGQATTATPVVTSLTGPSSNCKASVEFYKHPDCNDTLSPALGDEDVVAKLPVTRGKVGEPPLIKVVRSYWVPTEAELILLQTGRYCVALTLLGETHAPVRLDVCDAKVDIARLRDATNDKIHTH
jgi:hypothetical protein